MKLQCNFWWLHHSGSDWIKLQTSLSLSTHFNGHLPGVHGFADTVISLFLILLELRMMEVAMTTAAVRQSDCHH